jgi:hypothetical protein
MAYIGNEPGVGAFIVATERFNGNGSCTQFTLTQTGIQDANAIEVLVSNIQQDPINSYSVANGVITFTEAPPSAANNIIVTYRATTVITYNNIQNSQIPDGTITASKLASGVLPTATANSAASYANAAFAVANTVSSAGSFANSAFVAANSAGAYANSAFAAANNSLGTNLTQNTNITSAASYANAAFIQANTDFTNITVSPSQTYGNASYYPVITVTANGRINTVSTQIVTGIDAHPFLFTAMGS